MPSNKPAILCSAIIPTIGRPSLSRAVESVLAQSLDPSAFEVIVVNDSGMPLPAADWQSSPQVQIINTNRRERSVARNTGAAAARGLYLHFLDDDDWSFPHAYQPLSELCQTSTAKWLYGMTQLVDRNDRPTIRLRHHLNGNCFMQTLAGEWIPLQSSWIERETFLKLGGFNPLLAGPEDIDLLRRVLLQHEIVETPNLIAHVVMGGVGSSTDYAAHPRSSRWARESILDDPGAYSRMRSSAATAAWRGRMARVYLTSALWNAQQRRWITALGRLFLALLAMLQSGAAVLSLDFWQSMTSSYASITFEKGKHEARTEHSLGI